MASRSPLVPLLTEKRVLVVAGAGGVGKTTVAAALALSAAAQGRRVLCLTIDPAKRLFDRLGLNAGSEAEQAVDPAPFRAAGLTIQGSLTLVMLDTKRTFDDLVRKHASSAEVAERILENEFYEYVSTQLAGTQAYMAMEKVLAVLSDERFDLVVLDTPPTSDALDFLDAPERLVEVLDSAALRWLAQAFEQSGRLSLNLVARGVALVLRGIARLTGRGFLERLAEFVTEVNQLFGGFKERAHRVALAFRRPEFAYLLVATPAQPPLAEAAFFAERLERLGMRADALVVNRVLPCDAPEPGLGAIRAALAAAGSSEGSDLAERVLAAYRAERALAEIERRTSELFLSGTGPIAKTRVPLQVEVPSFPESVHDVAALTAVARRFL
jgi:anion-transporting  ArsA/GET3 family ATPase